MALGDESARFLIVGAYAVAVHGAPRSTGDIDIWIQPEPENAQRVWAALAQFGAPLGAMNLTPADLSRAETVYQIGQPPRRIDILTAISGVEFDEAWEARVEATIDDLELPFLGREHLLKNKLAAARSKDLADVKLLQEEQADGRSGHG